MRTIKHTAQFKRAYKREKKSGRYAKLGEDLLSIVELLVIDKRLPQRNYDHPLTGNWADHRDCHLKPDLVLIYRKPTQKTLELVRLGSHRELGL